LQRYSPDTQSSQLSSRLGQSKRRLQADNSERWVNHLQKVKHFSSLIYCASKQWREREGKRDREKEGSREREKVRIRKKD
jgi:hypothetical protein